MRISLLLLVLSIVGVFIPNGYGLFMAMFCFMAFCIVLPVQFINRLFEQFKK
jgi:energy-coupling factor transporter transmembrane protein EcfT